MQSVTVGSLASQGYYATAATSPLAKGSRRALQTESSQLDDLSRLPASKQRQAFQSQRFAGAPEMLLGNALAIGSMPWWSMPVLMGMATVFWIAYCMQDMVGIFGPRISISLLRGAKPYNPDDDPSVEKTPKFMRPAKVFYERARRWNWPNFGEEFGRELLMGPGILMVPTAFMFTTQALSPVGKALRMPFQAGLQFAHSLGHFLDGKQSPTTDKKAFLNNLEAYYKYLFAADEPLLSHTAEFTLKQDHSTGLQRIGNYIFAQRSAIANQSQTTRSGTVGQFVDEWASAMRRHAELLLKQKTPLTDADRLHLKGILGHKHGDISDKKLLQQAIHYLEDEIAGLSQNLVQAVKHYNDAHPAGKQLGNMSAVRVNLGNINNLLNQKLLAQGNLWRPGASVHSVNSVLEQAEHFNHFAAAAFKTTEQLAGRATFSDACKTLFYDTISRKALLAPVIALAGMVWVWFLTHMVQSSDEYPGNSWQHTVAGSASAARNANAANNGGLPLQASKTPVTTPFVLNHPGSSPVVADMPASNRFYAATVPMNPALFDPGFNPAVVQSFMRPAAPMVPAAAMMVGSMPFAPFAPVAMGGPTP
ncbi:MAG: hypothetical protein SFZ03_08875 [Candidatus Melainabacteria bacterium]|nr:hypothetical protein [Candidatus Melainabacteria bacterium]